MSDYNVYEVLLYRDEKDEKGNDIQRKLSEIIVAKTFDSVYKKVQVQLEADKNLELCGIIERNTVLAILDRETDETKQGEDE